MLDEILVARLHAGAALASAALLAVGGDGRALHVSAMADGDRGLLVGDQVFQLDFSSVVFNNRAPLVSVELLDFLQLGDDDSAQLLFRTENRFELRNIFAHLLQLVRNFVNREPGKAM